MNKTSRTITKTNKGIMNNLDNNEVIEPREIEVIPKESKKKFIDNHSSVHAERSFSCMKLLKTWTMWLYGHISLGQKNLGKVAIKFGIYVF